MATLLVRHLPPSLPGAAVDELLRHFGATDVRHHTASGPLQHTAFADFPDRPTAARALLLLHQRSILGRALVVEYARPQHQPNLVPTYRPEETKGDSSVLGRKKQLRRTVSQTKLEQDQRDGKQDQSEHVAAKKTEKSILTNISHALATHPLFYTHVLHLMNCLNLPAPFGPITPQPPCLTAAVNDTEPIRKRDRQPSPSDESELESDHDEAKRPKIVPVKPKAHLPKAPNRRIGIRLARAHPVRSVQPTLQPQPSVAENSSSNPPDTDDSQQKPPPAPSIDLVPLSDIEAGRMLPEELSKLPIMRNYSAGDPTPRLYLKNLPKGIAPKDLLPLFGHFIQPDDKGQYDIQVIGEGRLKGHGFVGCPSEERAQAALTALHGYVLGGKPMVLQFSRAQQRQQQQQTQ